MRKVRWSVAAMVAAVVGSFFHFMKVGASEVEDDEPQTRGDAREDREKELP